MFDNYRDWDQSLKTFIMHFKVVILLGLFIHVSSNSLMLEIGFTFQGGYCLHNFGQLNLSTCMR